MDAAGRGGYAAGMTVVGADLPPSTARAAVWRRPPRSAPEGRHASSGRSLAMLGVLVSLYVYSLAGAMLALAPGIPWAAALPPLVICAVGVGYGLVIIATARLPRMRLVMRDWGLGDSPAAKVWLGLAYILPLAGSFVAGWTLRAAGQLSSPLASSPLISYVGLFGPVAFAICLILARVCSLRAVKQAILHGRAPSFTVSSDGAWWWDGEAWTNVADATPESALRSPDTNYWWTGQEWIPLPPRPITR